MRTAHRITSPFRKGGRAGRRTVQSTTMGAAVFLLFLFIGNLLFPFGGRGSVGRMSSAGRDGLLVRFPTPIGSRDAFGTRLNLLLAVIAVPRVVRFIHARRGGFLLHPPRATGPRGVPSSSCVDRHGVTRSGAPPTRLRPPHEENSTFSKKLDDLSRKSTLTRREITLATSMRGREAVTAVLTRFALQDTEEHGQTRRNIEEECLQHLERVYLYQV